MQGLYISGRDGKRMGVWGCVGEEGGAKVPGANKVYLRGAI